MLDQNYYVDLKADLGDSVSRINPCGISSYRNVLVVWDADFNGLVLGFIDKLTPALQSQLVAVHEREGRLWLWWKDSVPKGYEQGREVDMDCDCWPIEYSATASVVKEATAV